MFTNHHSNSWKGAIQYVNDAVYDYSSWLGDYPYDNCTALQGALEAGGGMEYPTITVISADASPKGLDIVIAHEVGHNFFPMIINSDERQWTWMDEGLNTFVQYLAEKEYDRNYPTRRGPARNIVDYMRGDKSTMSPIMTNSENIIQFGPNAYSKPATGLNILRETIMGRELFDYAFKKLSPELTRSIL